MILLRRTSSTGQIFSASGGFIVRPNGFTTIHVESAVALSEAQALRAGGRFIIFSMMTFVILPSA